MKQSTVVIITLIVASSISLFMGLHDRPLNVLYSALLVNPVITYWLIKLSKKE